MTTIVEIYRTDGRHSEEGWTEAECDCGWRSWGANAESVTEGAVAEHLTESHPRLYRRYDFWQLVSDYA